MSNLTEGSTPAPTPLPAVQPSATPAPTALPSAQPTPLPAVQPSATPAPTALPSAQPTPLPAVQPTPLPTMQPTLPPTPLPTIQPTLPPTPVPTPLPTLQPTLPPTPLPTMQPTPTPSPTTAVQPTPTPFEQRGLLNVEVRLSHSAATAGTPFTVYFEIANPFAYPILIDQVNTSLPTEIERIDPTPVQRLSLNEKQRLESLIGDLSKVVGGSASRLGNAKRFFNRSVSVVDERQKALNELAKKLVSVSEAIATATGQRAQLAAQNAAAPSQQLQDQLDAKDEELDRYTDQLTTMRTFVVLLTNSAAVYSNGNMFLENATLPTRFYFEVNGSLQVKQLRIRNEEQLESVLPPGTPLQSGGKAVFSLELLAPVRLLFRPMAYTLYFNVLYSFYEPQKPAVLIPYSIPQTLTIRAPIWLIVAGAVVGGLGGYMARVLGGMNMGAIDGGRAIISGIVIMILSAAAVVFVARKSDTPATITVEDFLGGMVIGFLIGYVGTSFFDQIAGTTPGGAVLAPTPSVTPEATMGV